MDEVVAGLFSGYARWRSLRYLSATRGNFVTLAGYLHLPDPDLRRTISALCRGGLGSGSTCGVLSGSCIAVAAAHMAEIIACEGKAQHLYARSRELTSWFENRFGGTLCREIAGEEMGSIPGSLGWLAKGKAVRCCVISGRTDAKAAELMDRPLEWREPSAVDRKLAHQGGYCGAEVMASIRSDTGLGSLYLERLSMALDGGTALSGGLCGALGAAILSLGLLDGAARPLRSIFGLRDENTARRQSLVSSFHERFGSLECRVLTGEAFPGPLELSEHILGGGCAEIQDWCAGTASNIILDGMRFL
jgi:hypothetical protein